MQSPSIEAIVAAHQGKWGGVKRDMEVIRAVVAHIEDRTDVWPQRVTVDGLDDATVQAHVWMLHAEGMLNAKTPIHVSNEPTPRFEVRDLSWQGHELAAVLSETSWQRLTAKFSPAEMAAMTLKGVLEVGSALTVAWAKSALGLPPA